MILVTGATGNIGRRVVEGLALEGRPVRALVRDPAAVEAFEAMGVHALVGDVTRPDDRASALVDVQEILCCHAAYYGASEDDVLAVDGAATVGLIDEAVAAGVKQFVLLSHLGVDRARGGARFEAKQRAEAALARQDQMAYVILRLAPLMTTMTELPGVHNPGRTGSFIIFGRGDNRISPVSPADVATMVRRCSRRPEACGQVLSVGGPETFTWNELPALFERAYQTTVVTWRLPLFFLSLARLFVGLVNRPAADRLAYFEVLYGNDLSTDPARAVELFGVELEDFVGYLVDEEEAVAPPGFELPPETHESPPRRVMEGPRPTSPLEEELPEPPRREPEEPKEIEPEIELDEAPKPKLELPAEQPTEPLAEPAAPTAELTEPGEPAEPEWGQQVEFGADPPEPAEEAVERRPPVKRPKKVESPVVDLDPPAESDPED